MQAELRIYGSDGDKRFIRLDFDKFIESLNNSKTFIGDLTTEQSLGDHWCINGILDNAISNARIEGNEYPAYFTVEFCSFCRTPLPFEERELDRQARYQRRIETWWGGLLVVSRSHPFFLVV